MEFTINANNVILNQLDQVESGEYNVTECNFTFSNEYEGLTKKAVFTGEDGLAYLETIVDNKCPIPSEILSINQVVQIGVYAYAVDDEELLLRYSPEPTQFYIHQGSYKEAQNSTPPTPTEIEQLQSQITQNANDIDALEQTTSEHTTDITDIKAEQITQNDNIQTNTNNIQTINEEIVTINQEIDNLEQTKADKSEIPTKTSDLINDSDFVSDANYVHTDNNFTNADKSQITTNKNDIADIKAEQITQNTNIQNNSNAIGQEITNRRNADVDLQNQIDAIDTLLNNKVDKVQGKGLSTNDFTDAYKNQITANQNAIAGITDGTTINSFGAVETVLSGKEDKSNKVTSISSLSTDIEYPSAKCVYDELAEKQTEIDNLEADLEEAQNSIVNLETDVEDLRNASIKLTGTGTDITLNNTASARLLENSLRGNINQIQLTGKNLYSGGNQTFTKDKSVNVEIIPAGTYIFSGNCQSNDTDSTESLVIFYKNNTQIGFSYVRRENYSKTLTLSDDCNRIVFYASNNAVNSEGDTANFSNIMIRNSSISDDTFEPFCGGIPAPNLSYEIPIKNVTGNANEKIQNKNLFVPQKIVDDSNNQYVYLDENGNVVYITREKLKIILPFNKPNTAYTFKLILKNNADTINNFRFTIHYTDGTSFSTPNYPVEDKDEHTLIFSTNPDKTIDYINDNYTYAKSATIITNGSMILEGTYTSETIPLYVSHQEQNFPFTFEEGQFLADDEELQDDGIHKKWKQVTFSGTTATLSDAKTNGAYYCNKKVAGNLVGQTLTFDEEVTNAIIQYELATPETIPYNSNQASQYEAKKNARSYADKTYITSTSNEEGFDMYVVSIGDANKIINDIDTRLLALESEV